MGYPHYYFDHNEVILYQTKPLSLPVWTTKEVRTPGKHYNVWRHWAEYWPVIAAIHQSLPRACLPKLRSRMYWFAGLRYVKTREKWAGRDWEAVNTYYGPYDIAPEKSFYTKIFPVNKPIRILDTVVEFFYGGGGNGTPTSC